MDKQKSAHVADISQRNGATADTVRVPSAARVTIVRSRLTACLVVLDVVLAVASIPSHLVSYYRPDATFEPITRRFSGELSIPAWYSAMLLAACALLLWTIARAGMAAVDRWRFHWLF